MTRLTRVARIPDRRVGRTSCWLIFGSGCRQMEALTTRLSGGKEALPVFSFREEAEMFLCLRGLKDSWQAREIRAGELRSMLYAAPGNVGSVVPG